jgi:hypothetical protein
MITSEKLDARPQLKVLLTQILAVKMYGGPQPLHHEALAEVKVTPRSDGSENSAKLSYERQNILGQSHILTDLKISFTAQGLMSKHI